MSRAAGLRLLLLADYAYGEPSNGAARSVQCMVEWLAEAGATCTAVTSGRFEQTARPDPRAHHDSLGVPVERNETAGPRSVARFRLRGVDVTAVETLPPSREGVDAEAEEQLAEAFLDALDAKPDLVLAYGGHRATQFALAQAREAGVRTVFTVRGWGYDDRRFFTFADRALLNSSFHVDAYRRSIGLRADWLPSPLRWDAITATEDARAFLTLINPSLHKGAALFARLADMLGRERPDIPILIVQSHRGAAELAQVLDLGRHPQIVVSPPVPNPRTIYALTRILLVPSATPEPFGRVAAEAMVNGIPPLVSASGGLPETVGGGGVVLPLPASVAASSRALPGEAEVRPWFDAVTRLWDDGAAYAEASTRARAEAERLYGEPDLRRRYVDYFTDPGPFPPLFPPG